MSNARNIEEKIEEAVLIASNPEAVFSFLKKRADKLSDNPYFDTGESTEASLLARNNPLIDLALARYCLSGETAHSLFFKIPQNAALRLSVLSNQAICGVLVSIFPDKDNLSAYLASAAEEELSALFANPRIGDSFLRDFLEGDKNWQSMSEESRLIAVRALSENPRMKTPYDASFMDGYAEYSHNAVFTAAWKLSETAPTSIQWASTLGWLYEYILPIAFSIDSPLNMASRWHPDETQEERMYRHYSRVRKGLARLALKNSPGLSEQLLQSEDSAFRFAVYAYSKLSPVEIGKAYEKDGELAFMEMVHNLNLWRCHESRQRLHDIAWAVVNNDKYSDLMAANIFNGKRETVSKEHPDWFDDDEDDYKPEPSNEPATKADIQELAAHVSRYNSTDSIKATLDRIYNRLGFIWWFSLGALVVTLIRYL